MRIISGFDIPIRSRATVRGPVWVFCFEKTLKSHRIFLPKIPKKPVGAEGIEPPPLQATVLQTAVAKPISTLHPYLRLRCCVQETPTKRTVRPILSYRQPYHKLSTRFVFF